MPQFKVGDAVERIAASIRRDLRSGIVICIVPNKSGIDCFNEYVIIFDGKDLAIRYESELRLVKPAQN